MTLVEEWVHKAEGDYKAAVALNRLRKEPQPDIVCYHCQQSAEKYLKAVLVHFGIAPPRTHSLMDLLADCAVVDSSVTAWSPLVQALDPFSVRFRYPGMDASTAEAQIAILEIRNLRRVARKALGL
jgi:HEPN domain-containing protein